MKSRSFFRVIFFRFAGSLFYAYAPMQNLGLGRGYYMAVNIGYSIGFGYPAEPYEPYLWFSTVYVLVSLCPMSCQYYLLVRAHDGLLTRLCLCRLLSKHTDRLQVRRSDAQRLKMFVKYSTHSYIYAMPFHHPFPPVSLRLLWVSLLTRLAKITTTGLQTWCKPKHMRKVSLSRSHHLSWPKRTSFNMSHKSVRWESGLFGLVL